MVKCAGCGESFKKSKAIRENFDGKDYMFCCRGCRQLLWMKIQQFEKNKPLEWGI